MPAKMNNIRVAIRYRMDYIESTNCIFLSELG